MASVRILVDEYVWMWKTHITYDGLMSRNMYETNVWCIHTTCYDAGIK